MAAPGVAVPGSVVAIGSQTSPAGAQGVAGINAVTTTTAGFTVPAVGSTVSVTVVDASWIVVGQMVYVDQAGGGPGLSGVLQVQNKTGNTLTLLNPQPAPAIPLASSASSGLLAQTSGNTTDFVDGTNACQNLVSAVQPTIWSARLRSFNAIGSPTFGVDQRLNGNVTGIGGFVCDRWSVGGALAANCTTARVGQTTPGILYAAGTSFRLSLYCISVTLNTQKTSLAAADALYIQQTVEGIQFRELMSDAHSLTLAVQSTVAPLTFCICLRDNANAWSLTKQCTISTANVWTFITLPNLPVWTPSGSFSFTPGTVAYQCFVTLAAGTNQQGSIDSWKSTGQIGSATQDNFCAKPVNSVFYLGFVQHEPGPLCTTAIDCPFSQNYDDCLRYFTKSYNYEIIIGTVDTGNRMQFIASNATTASGQATFPKPMAKRPTLTVYSDASGAINNVRDPDGGGVDRAASNLIFSTKHFIQLTMGTASAVNNRMTFHYTADTGW
jgi:hypothetical protein